MNRIFTRALLCTTLCAIGCSKEEAAPATSEAMDGRFGDKAAAKMEMPNDAPPPPPPPPGAPAPEAILMADEGFAQLNSVGGGGSGMGLAGVGAIGRGEAKMKKASPARDMKERADRGRKGGAKDMAQNEKADQAPAAPTMRAWFPETFLFAPKVITGDDGTGKLDVLVPDRLTTWRVLALAHSRQGAQAGAVTTFTSNLPVSVDIVVPPFLMAGDRAYVPIQVANTTDKGLVRALTTKAENATWTGAPSSVSVEALGTSSSSARLDVTRPGDVALEASTQDDAVRRIIPVHSSGKPLRADKSGTLAAKRTFSLPLDVTTGAVLDGSARASLRVYPGALAILRAELASAPERSSLHDDAYLTSLTGRARELSVKLGAPVDATNLLRLQRLASQRVARYAVAPDLFSAMALAPGALSHDAESLLARNGEHLAAQVARAQRPDGTFAGADGWTVQRLLVATADGLAAVQAGASASGATDEAKRRGAAATLRTRGAFERLAGQIKDPYTAARVVASGTLADETNAEMRAALRKLIVDAIVTNEDGTKMLAVPDATIRADASTPSPIEMTAWAVLALSEDLTATALLPDLGAYVLSSYRAGRGFGDGTTNRVALDAVMLLFSTKLPERVVVSLTVDGKSAGKDTLEGARLQEVMTLDALLEDADIKDGKVDVVVEADPPLPGLSFALELGYAVPWPKPDADAGLTLDVIVPPGLAVGKSAELELRAVAPGGSALKISQGLPAGVDVVRSSLEALQAAGTITSFTIEEGVLVLQAPSRPQGQLFSAKVKVVPSLAGTLHARVGSAQVVSRPNDVVFVPPTPWTIAAR